MEFRKDGDTFIIRLARGERLQETMKKFLEQTGVKGGELQAIGAVDEVELGLYHVDTQTYVWKKFEGEYEVVGLTGTITETGLHAHGVISDENFACFGGHFKEARVSGMLEVFLREHKKIRRQLEPSTGLNVMEL